MRHLVCAGYTTWSALRDASPQPHEKFAVLRIGGLRHVALQLAKASGFETIAIAHSPDKHDLATQLGADHVVAIGEELADVGGTDVLLVNTNTVDAGEDAMSGLRPDGRVILSDLDFSNPFTISPQDVPLNTVRQQIIDPPTPGQHYLGQVLDLASKGEVEPMTETFTLDQAIEAYDRLSSGEMRFRGVFTPHKG